MTHPTWPQVPPFTGSRRGTERARWPEGIAILALGAAALLSACGGNGDDQLEPDARKGNEPVDCVATPERCR